MTKAAIVPVSTLYVLVTSAGRQRTCSSARVRRGTEEGTAHRPGTLTGCSTSRAVAAPAWPAGLPKGGQPLAIAMEICLLHDRRSIMHTIFLGRASLSVSEPSRISLKQCHTTMESLLLLLRDLNSKSFAEKAYPACLAGHVVQIRGLVVPCCGSEADNPRPWGLMLLDTTALGAMLAESRRLCRRSLGPSQARERAAP